VSEARHQIVDTRVEGDEFALTVGSVKGREGLTRSSASAQPSARACGRQSVSSESSISLTGIRQRAAGSIRLGIHPVAGRQAVLSKDLGARHQR
jgi:hypothetical protein